MTPYWKYVVSHERLQAPIMVIVCLINVWPRLMFVEIPKHVYCNMTSFWKRIKVPRGCYAHLSTFLTYKGEELREENSGLWMMAYTEFIARILAFLLFKADYNPLILVLSRNTCLLTLMLTFEPILESMADVFRALWIFGAIYIIRFDSLLEICRCRGGYTPLMSVVLVRVDITCTLTVKVTVRKRWTINSLWFIPTWRVFQMVFHANAISIVCLTVEPAMMRSWTRSRILFMAAGLRIFRLLVYSGNQN